MNAAQKQFSLTGVSLKNQLPISKATQTANTEMEGDLVLREVWRAKDALSAARGHSIDKLFADLRKREKKSGHPVVNLQQKRKNRDAKERTTK